MKNVYLNTVLELIYNEVKHSDIYKYILNKKYIILLQVFFIYVYLC